ncbi:MAG: hypothetical protein R3B99_02130 [Polyangiales bacterium]
MQHCEPSLSHGAFAHEGVISTRLGLRGAPRQAEESAVVRDLSVAELTGALHVAHVSSSGAVARIRDAKSRGVLVTADVTPHHLTWTDEALLGFDTAARVIPPLREASDRDALRRGLADGTIDCIATDHAPHAPLEKECELAEALPGMIGLETALPLVLALVRDGVLTRRRAVEALTTARTRARPLATLTDASDLTVIDPEHAWTPSRETLRSKSTNTLLLGREVRRRAPHDRPWACRLRSRDGRGLTTLESRASARSAHRTPTRVSPSPRSTVVSRVRDTSA